MHAALSEEQQALRDMATALAGDLATAPADKAWEQLRATGLLDLRADGAGTLELALCAEAFGAAAGPTPFLGATLALALHPMTANAVAALDGDLAPDGFGADTVVVLDGDRVLAGPSVAADPTADRSRVAVRPGA